MIGVWVLVVLALSAEVIQGSPHNPETDREGRGIIKDKILAHSQGLANKLFGKAGILECNGIQSVTRGTFLHQLFGDRPTLGNAMCGPTCGGHCQALNSFADAPTTISYAFGCKCPAQRCSPGPIPDTLDNPSFKVVCERDPSCTCSGMNFGEFGAFIQQTGYLCNWVDANSNEKVTFGQVGGSEFQLHPAVLPVSWCSCCPTSSSY